MRHLFGGGGCDVNSCAPSACSSWLDSRRRLPKRSTAGIASLAAPPPDGVPDSNELVIREIYMLSYKPLAARMGVSPKMVRRHAQNLECSRIDEEPFS